jgi:integrase
VTERPRLGAPFARSAAVEVSYFYVRTGHAIPRREKWPITGAIQEDNLVARSIADLTRRPVGGRDSADRDRAPWLTSLRCATAAVLPTRCKPHGLRKAACRRLAEAGCSANEIMAISGHATMKELVRYTKAADQARLARNAMAKAVIR